LKNKKIFSLSVISLLFVSFLTICSPVINADDDFYFLYTLSGGFGDSPTNFLHYAYTWNPLISWHMLILFKFFPGINHYTITLLLVHFSTCALLLYSLLVHLKKSFAVISFLLYFVFIESRLLLSLNYSNTSITGAICASISILVYYTNRPGFNMRSAWLVISSLLLFFSGLLRLHTTGLVFLIVTGIALFIIPKDKLKIFVTHLSIIIILVIGFSQFHKLYYANTRPSWQKEENMRQALFSISNTPTKKITSLDSHSISNLKDEFIKQEFLYDDFINTEDVLKFSQENKYIRSGNELHQILYWSFIESRVYILLFITLLLLFLACKEWKIFTYGLIISLATIGIFIFFLTYLKVKEGIFLSLISGIFFYCIISFKKIKPFSKVISGVIAILLSLSCFWMVHRLVFFNSSNITQTSVTRCWMRELNKFPSILFVSADNSLITKGYGIWDTPKEYPIYNLLDKGFIYNKTYENTLKRFRINNFLEDLPNKENVRLMGNTLPPVTHYYKLSRNLDVKIDTIKYFDCFPAFRLQ
jgi:hypothetical protein